MKVLQFKGADSIYEYSENVFILYVEEYCFNKLNEPNQTEAVQRYKANKQILGFINGEFKEL